MPSKQDRNGVRTASDVERRHKLSLIEPTAEEVNKLKDDIVVDTQLSTTSTHPLENRVITQNLNNKVNKETGKGLSTNDFTNEYKNSLENSSSNSHTHSNKEVLDSITSEKIEIWDNAGSYTSYGLSSCAETGVTILRSACGVKNNRVCINFVGTKSIEANTTTTLFTLPEEVRPSETKDFIAFGQTSNNDGYIGYGFVTSEGLLQVRFNTTITSYIRFSFVYDMY